MILTVVYGNKNIGARYPDERTEKLEIPDGARKKEIMEKAEKNAYGQSVSRIEKEDGTLLWSIIHGWRDQ